MITKKNISVLFIGGGKRCTLAKFFIDYDCNIIAYESSDNCPINNFADVIIGTSFDDYKVTYEHILNIIEKHNPHLVIPLYDTATPILADMVQKVSTKIVVSSTSTVNICLNKLLFEDFMLDNFEDFYPSIKNDCDIIGKPINGCGSKGLYRIPQGEGSTHRKRDNYIYQKFIQGDEYTVDGYVNLDGKCIGCVPRLREEVLGGEISKGKIVWDEDLIDLTKIIAEKLRIRGPFGIQYIKEYETNKIYCLECNPRFNGGSTLSIAAGFDMVAFILQEYYVGVIRKVCPPINKNLKFKRYFSDYYYE